MIAHRKLLLVATLFLAHQICATAETAPAKTSTTAAIDSVSDRDLSLLDYATRFRITVALREKLTYDQIRDPRTFELTDSLSNRPIPIRRAVYSGLSDGDKYDSAFLYADIKPATGYSLIINYPAKDGANAVLREKIQVTLPDKLKPESESATKLQLIGRRFSLEVEPLLSPGVKDVGVRYSAKMALASWKGWDFGNLTSAINASTEGELSTESTPKEFKNSLTAGVEATWLGSYGLSFEVGDINAVKERRSYAYPFGFKIKPVEFEATQDMDIVDYTVKAQIVSAVPYSDLPVLWINGLMGVRRSFFPLLISVGYTRVEKLNDKVSKLKADDLKNRLDIEAVYNFPVTNDLEINLRYRYFSDWKTDGSEHLFEGGATYYLDQEHKKGLTISYVDGAVAPYYKDATSVRLGFSIKHF